MFVRGVNNGPGCWRLEAGSPGFLSVFRYVIVMLYMHMSLDVCCVLWYAMVQIKVSRCSLAGFCFSSFCFIMYVSIVFCSNVFLAFSKCSSHTFICACCQNLSGCNL